MTLYHGSDQIIKTPELRPSTRTIDFGAGFYTTTNKEQAVNFAVKVYTRLIREGNTPKGKYISVYEADYEKMNRNLIYCILNQRMNRGLILLWLTDVTPITVKNMI